MTAPETFTAPFWESLAAGRVTLTECSDCGTPFFPPAPACPHCHSTAVDWVPVTDPGTLYSFTRQYRTPPGFDEPNVLGLVELRETVRVLAPIAAPYEALSIGMPVELQACMDSERQESKRPSGHYFEAVPVTDE